MGRVWYFLEEGESGVREGEVVVVEMGREGVYELGEGCPATRVGCVGERVEDGGGRVDAAVVTVEEEIGKAREDVDAEDGEGRNGHVGLGTMSTFTRKLSTNLFLRSFVHLHSTLI